MICLAGCDKTIPGVTMVLPRLNAVSQVQKSTHFVKGLCVDLNSHCRCLSTKIAWYKALLLSVPTFSVYKNVRLACFLPGKGDVVLWMGSHFHDWIDFNGVAFSIEVLALGRRFSDFWGKKILVSRNSKWSRLNDRSINRKLGSRKLHFPKSD